MDLDWKDKLSSLRSSFNEPEPEQQMPEKEVNNLNKKPQQTPVRIITDKKGRNGKIATIIEGFTIESDKVEDLARKLKQKLGVGGSVREGEILIQGDHKEAVKSFLENLKFKTR